MSNPIRYDVFDNGIRIVTPLNVMWIPEEHFEGVFNALVEGVTKWREGHKDGAWWERETHSEKA